MNALEDVSSVSNFITAYEESQDSHFLICNVSLLTRAFFGRSTLKTCV